MHNNNPIEVLRARGFVQDITDEDALAKLLDTEQVTFYVGFDPTAVSLHAGNLVGIMGMAWLQRMGHRAIAIAGGATGRIGDPSGRDSERELLTDELLERNLAGIREQLSRFLDLVDPTKGILVDNHDWIGPLSFLDFLRDVGKHFSVNQMIARESVKRRLEDREQGISFTEFSYQLLQSYDFAHLFEAEGCRLQAGGSDQWGNIVAGVDLTRRMHGGEVYGLTWPLLTTSDGRKFGKSSGVSVWLDPALTSPYAYYQYWLNAPDGDVEGWLKLFTFLPLDEIATLMAAHAEAPFKRAAQRRLAEEATRICHGEDGLAQAIATTEVLFGDAPFSGLSEADLAVAFEGAPSASLARSALDGGELGLLELLVEVGAAASNGEARRLVDQGGVKVNNAPATDASAMIGPADLATETTVVVRVGKKRYFLARFR